MGSPGDSENILFLDPSSSCTGYSVFNTIAKMIDGGLIKPTHRDDPTNDRIATMLQEILNLAREYSVKKIVIEDTTGKVSGRHKGKGAGLSIYGKAIGYFMGALKMKGFEVVAVLENTWTAGTSKADRQASVMVRYKTYRPENDTGQDLSDAIRLGEWYFEQQALDAQFAKGLSV